MMTRRRPLWAWLASGLCLLALVACGEDDTTPADNSNNSASNNDNNGNNAEPNNSDPNNSTNPNNSSYMPEPYLCDGISGAGYIAPAGDECDMLAQDCAEGEGCYLTGGAAECFPPTERQVACGELCEANNQCAPGQICAGSPGRCLGVCPANGECPGASACESLQGRDDLGVCVPPRGGQPCSVLEQDCPAGLSCYLIEGREACAVTIPEPEGAGARCSEANGCQPGFVCVGASAEDLRCLRACDPEDTTACSGDFCTGIEGNPGLGVCF